MLERIKEMGSVAMIVTVVGTYYIVGRDTRCDRVEIGMKRLCSGRERRAQIQSTMGEWYSEGEND